MDPNLQAVLLWQHHQTTTPFVPGVGGMGTKTAARDSPVDPPAGEEEDEEEEESEEEEEESGKKY